jgi:ATP-dependent Clp protease adaptor protein ClpS
MAVKELTRPASAAATVDEQLRRIVLFNDEVNTFDWVIECLVKICDHTPEQAEQCAYFVHYKGRYAVKHGSYEELEPPASALAERGLTVEIQ